VAAMFYFCGSLLSTQKRAWKKKDKYTKKSVKELLKKEALMNKKDQ
jgi:hypothetical protein